MTDHKDRRGSTAARENKMWNIFRTQGDAVEYSVWSGPWPMLKARSDTRGPRILWSPILALGKNGVVLTSASATTGSRTLASERERR
ncbi:uncharacterized protein FFB20_15230 [Fusarium fujikuroi]|nr:uncharacterized protein FFE2_00654 [Fusarium fujikuroi]SCN69725.1 uncharacterized protein FFC1_00650 [Fusarium fujikuroi]SCO17415.1 uncharacterized protein FFB20_15230 [Fusarium fujikuroi]SCO28983.1 uncharacterized protein FFNC_00653 [Fusarium fujikuroi]SCO29880.1 uncharacterized protein FFMR_01576 [Fusarium fujikuroi]